MEVEKEITIWITYHDDAQIEQYELKDDDTIRLFKGNSLDVEGENINHLNKFYSEMTTMYWVWKNNIRSNNVGFCHYRRRFTHLMEIEQGECQVMEAINFPFTVFHHYKDAHNYNDFYDIVDILNERYGEGNKYSEYMLNSKTFIPFCSFVMKYDDFESLCEFFFPILFPDGTVDKCDNIDPSEARGFLNNNGNLIWKENIPHIQNTIFSEHYSSPCIMCKHLPICYGPCPRSRDEMLRHNDFINCNIESPDDYWNQKILDYCHSFEKK